MKIRLIGRGECLYVGALGCRRAASHLLLNHHVIRKAKGSRQEHLRGMHLEHWETPCLLGDWAPAAAAWVITVRGESDVFDAKSTLRSKSLKEGGAW
jgi:hypothetical protein